MVTTLLHKLQSEKKAKNKGSDFDFEFNEVSQSRHNSFLVRPLYEACHGKDVPFVIVQRHLIQKKCIDGFSVI